MKLSMNFNEFQWISMNFNDYFNEFQWNFQWISMIYVSLKIDWKRNVCPMILINVCPSRFDRKLNECPMRLINVCPLDVPTPPPPCSRFLINSTYYTFRPPPFQPILSRCTHLSPTLFNVWRQLGTSACLPLHRNSCWVHLPSNLEQGAG